VCVCVCVCVCVGGGRYFYSFLLAGFASLADSQKNQEVYVLFDPKIAQPP